MWLVGWWGVRWVVGWVVVSVSSVGSVALE